MTGPAWSSQDRARHWSTAYHRNGGTGMSWFQVTPTVSLELIDVLEVPPDAGVIDIGGGTSSFVDHLIGRGFTDLSVLDISDAALDEARGRLPDDAPVSWVCEDVLTWTPRRGFDLWHDRAVFHFLTAHEDRETYLDVLRSALSLGGGLVMATFADDGPEYCSGLPVARYSASALAAMLGNAFDVIAERREMHATPSGVVQPFTWVAARKD